MRGRVRPSLMGGARAEKWRETTVEER